MRRILLLAVMLSVSVGAIAWAEEAVAPQPLPVLGSQKGKNGLVVFEQRRRCGVQCGRYWTGAPGIYTYDVRSGARRLLVRGRPASSPHFSPNGRKIVFSNRKFGQTDIYTMKFDGSKVRQVTDDLSEEFEPVFLEDGRIAYVYLDGLTYRYFSINQNGSGRQTLGDYNSLESPGTVSPKNGDIAYASCEDEEGPCHIFLHDPLTGSTKQVTQGDVIDSHPTFTPDGGRIGYVRTRLDDSEDCCEQNGVWFMVAKGKRNRQIRWPAQGAEFTGLKFSPDGRKLLVESFRPHRSGNGGTGWITISRLDGSKKKRIRASKGRGVVQDADWQSR